MLKKTCILLLTIFCVKVSSTRVFEFSKNVDEAVLRIDQNQWLKDVKHLSSYNRHYRSAEIMQARDWLVDQFTQLDFKVSLEEISIGGVKGYNIIAEIQGSEKAEDIFIVGAHYDSTSEKPQVSAPGAEDNASGTAGLLAIARAIVQSPPKATVRLIAFSGEEAGLVGSIKHAQGIVERGEQSRIKGVLIMDMIGYTQDNDLDCLIETSEKNQPLVDLLFASAERYTNLRMEKTFHYWGSDHVPFIKRDIPAALLIENDYEGYPDYHRSSDLPANIDVTMGGDILRMGVAVLTYWLEGGQY